MNESASNASLSFSTGAKPSTATSTSSSTTRKTRTIIVARSVPDAPAPSAATQGRDRSASLSRSASTASASAVMAPVASLPHARDARSGKLAPYAALGGEEDVERFDQFLAQQRGQPSASEARAASSSPQHMLASMKRKTMSLLHMNADGDGGNNAAETGDAAVDQQMRAELEKDALKRREEAVARRKWLKSLPIHERLAQQRQQKTLRRWRQVNRDWEAFKARAARRLGKPEQELVMSRASGYREQREMLDALQKARPVADKVGGDVWLVSLRDEGTRFVPVGNIFSGLFCPVRESTRLGPRIRRPLDYLHGHDDKSSKPLSILEKRSLTLLARKKWRLRKQLKELLPHEVQRSASSHLTVETTDLFAWAAGTAAVPGPDTDEGSVRTYVDDDALSDHRRRSLRPSLSQTSVRFPLDDEPEQVVEAYAGPSLRIAPVLEAEESSGAVIDEDARACRDAAPCPSPLRLSFYTSVGEQQQRTLAVSNDGSTIVHFQWWRARFEDEGAEMTTHLRGRRTRKDEQELESRTFTSLSPVGGTLLPGETTHFVFSFQSAQPGVFLKKWLLDADPRPRIRYGVGSATTSEQDVEAESEAALEPAALPVEVRLSCTAVDNFAPWKRRRAQLGRVEQRETHFFAARLLDEILDTVAPPEPVVFAALAPRADVTKFYASNDPLRSPAFSDVYYSPELVRGCSELYEKARQVLLALTPKPPVEDAQREFEAADEGEGAEKDTRESGGASSSLSSSRNVHIEAVESTTASGKGAEEHALAVAMARLVVAWDWRLETLRDVCRAADAAQYAEIRRLTRQLKRENEELEDEEDEDEDDDAEDGDDDGDDADDGANGMSASGRPKPVRLSRQELRARERRARREALEGEIAELHPQFQETFDTMRLASCVAPYSTARLDERLYERIGALCSETPVVCEIAQSLHGESGTAAVRAATVEGVGKLLTRAIDEAVGGDMDHQAQFEQARRRSQGMWLRDKLTYDSLPQWLASHTSSTPLAASSSTASVASTENDDNKPKTRGKTESASWDSSGVLLLHVDLDLAAWFGLVKAGKGASPSSGEAGATPRVEQALTWRFSPDLAQHETYVPLKVAQAVDALNKLLDAVVSADASDAAAIHTVVLVSELSRPPVTKPMFKLLRNATLAEMKALTPPPYATTAESARGTARGEDEDEDVEARAIELSLQRLAPQLSLKGVTSVVQRAADKDVVFCSTLEELEGQVEFSRKEMLASAPSSSGDAGKRAETTEDAGEAGPEPPAGTRATPRILLLEHVTALGRELLNSPLRAPDASSSKPGTPAPPEPLKAGAGAAKKGAPVSNRKPSTPVTASGAGSGTVAGSTPDTPREVRKSELEAPETVQKGMTLVRDRFARMCSACVLDGIPVEICERAFAFAHVGDEREGAQLPAYPVPPTFAGASLGKELAQWATVLQPAWPRPSQSERSKPCVVTAIVGGRRLESKLRLIDSLLEVASEIYFVGEVAMSLYRVLHTKQQRQQEQREQREAEDDMEVPHDDDLELDAEENNAEEPNEEEALEEAIPEEEEPNDDGLDKEARDESSQGGSSTGLPSVWDLLVPAVEKLQQKASRKCVRLLLPVDWIVGETPLEDQEPGGGVEEEEEDDDDDDEEEDEEEDEEDSEEGAKKVMKRRKSQELKNARRKPLVEPDEVDFLELRKQSTYEGDKAHVMLDHTVSRASAGSVVGWQTFRNVSARCLAHARVADGKSGVLSSLWTDAADAEADDADELEGSGEAGEEGPAHATPPPPRFEYEWTFRALDVGPLAMGSLSTQLKLAPSIGASETLAAAPTEQRVIILNGVCGAVEFREFSNATKQLITLLQSHAAFSPDAGGVLIAGRTTARWLRRLEVDQHTKRPVGQGTAGAETTSDGAATEEDANGGVGLALPARKLVDGRMMRNAHVLKLLLAAKPHPLLTRLVSTYST